MEASLDVEKAFDKVYHSELFSVLLERDVDVHAVAALRRLYRGMRAYVQLWPGAESRFFEVQRGVRQGDPLSPVLFNLVLAQVLAEVDSVWQRRGYGTNVGQAVRGRRLTHIAFADDMALVARTWLSLKRMVMTVRAALSQRGLQLHPSKCKAQTNSVASVERGQIQLEQAFSLSVLAEGEGLELLGTKLSLQDVTKDEVHHRIAVGWRKFWAMRRLLLNKGASIKKRLRLFDACIGSSVLWCSCSWTPRVDEMRSLRTAQNGMLRRICGTRRHDGELWLDWMKRATHGARALAEEARVRDWVHTHGQYTWAWAGHVARRSSTTWLWRVSTWRNSQWNQIVLDLGGLRPLRPSTHRWMKWEDALRRYCAEAGVGSWLQFASDKSRWLRERDQFAEWLTSFK